MFHANPRDCAGSDRVLKAKKHQLDLVDGVRVEVQIQFEFGDGGRHDASFRRVNKVPQDADDLLDVLHREQQLLAALESQVCINKRNAVKYITY